MARKQDIDVGIIAFTGFVGALLLLIIIWGVEGWYHYEVDLLLEKHNVNQNMPLSGLKQEHYRNLGDDVGNDIVYASEVADLGDATAPGFGYRWTDNSRQTAAIPIHEAMARVVQQAGGQEVTAQQMREVDRQFVRTINNAYADVMVPTSTANPNSNAAGGAQPRSGEPGS